jgi:hypothetical protein
MFQLSDETLQFDLDKIKWKAKRPVGFRKIGHDKTHAKFALANMV